MNMKGYIVIEVLYTLIYMHTLCGYPVGHRSLVLSSGTHVIVKIHQSDGTRYEPQQHPRTDKILSHSSGLSETERFLRTNFSDIRNGTAGDGHNRRVSVQRAHLTSSNKQLNPKVNSIKTSQRAAPDAHLQIPHAEEHDRESLGQAQPATGVDRKQGQISQQHRLDQTRVDFLQSQTNPELNHADHMHPGPGSVALGELRRNTANSADSQTQYIYNYGVRAENIGVDSIEKAEALGSNLETARPQTRTATMVLVISSTIVVLLVTCVTVSIFQCCCRKKRSSEEQLESETEEKQETENAVPTRDRNSIHEQTPSYRPITLSSSEDGLEDVPQLSVRDKIKAIEGQKKAEQNNKPVTSPEHAGKPVRKRPKSKAFEEFESQGIIIGMGMVKQGRPRSSTEIDEDMDITSPLSENSDTGLLGEIMASMSEEYNNSALSDSQENRPENSVSQEPEIDMSNSYMDDDDEFSVIQRNTQILRSFKRAPPPKNRTKSKRSSRRRLPLQDTTNLSTNSVDSSVNISTFSKDEEEVSPTYTSVQRARPDLGSPSIHSSESFHDMSKMTVVHAPVNGAVSKGEELRAEAAREPTPRRQATPQRGATPDKSAGKASKPAADTVRMYENPCYESIDVVRKSINRTESSEKPSNGTHVSPAPSDPKKTPPTEDRHVSILKGNNRISPPKSETRISPPKSDVRTSPPKSDDRISPPKSDDRISQPISDQRISSPKSDDQKSPPKIDDRKSPPKSDDRISPQKSDRISSLKGDSRIPLPRGHSRISPPKSQMSTSPPKSEIRDLAPDYDEGIPNASKNSRTSLSKNEKRTSPMRGESSTAPKNGTRASPHEGEEKDHTRKIPENNNAASSLRQTHL